MRFNLLAATLLAAAAPLAHGIAIAAAPTEAGAGQPEPTPEQKALVARMKALLESLHPEQGDVAIASAKTVLHLGKDYYFLPAEEAKRVLTEGWGNPPEAVGNVLGMVFPKGRTFLDDGWGAVVTYQPTGYVSDDDAKTVDYDAMVKSQQDDETDLNAERTKAGYPAQHLVGWAQPPVLRSRPAFIDLGKADQHRRRTGGHAEL